MWLTSFRRKKSLIIFVVILVTSAMMLFRGRGNAHHQPKESPRLYTFHVRRQLQHDHRDFTQGLIHLGGTTFLESTGLYGRSRVVCYDAKNQDVLKERKMNPMDFGEGLALINGRLYQLTYRSPIAYEYDQSTLELRRKLITSLRSGWGLTPLPGGEALVATDGSDKMYHLEPDTLETLRVVQVKDNGRPVKWVNELEQIGQEVWANIWHTECIARIDPWNGNVQSWIVLDGITDMERGNRVAAMGEPDVLNGIAYNSDNGRLFVTGKLFSTLFEIDVLPLHNGGANSHACVPR